MTSANQAHMREAAHRHRPRARDARVVWSRLGRRSSPRQAREAASAPAPISEQGDQAVERAASTLLRCSQDTYDRT